MTLIADYPTKQDLKAAVGQRLKYIDVGVFPEYQRDGRVTVSNRPHLREFFAIGRMA